MMETEEERCKVYYKFVKMLTLKVAQVVVQSRQGKKITHQSIENLTESGDETAPQWFNLYIPSEPAVTEATRLALGGEGDGGAGGVCVEISLRVGGGARVPLELWAVRLRAAAGAAPCSPSAAYCRMSAALKAALTVSRATPAYRLARAQRSDAYTIDHRIFAGEPNYDDLGEERKQIRVSEVRTPVGAVSVELWYRTRLALPAAPAPPARSAPAHAHARPDLSRPLRPAAFVDTDHIERLHRTLGTVTRSTTHQPVKLVEDVSPLAPLDECGSPASHTSHTSPARHEAAPPSRAIHVPASKTSCTDLMEFPFASSSPVSELASFYRWCGAGRSLAAAWDGDGAAPLCDGAALAAQLRDCEAAVPEFDEMVASMLAHAE